LQIIAAVNCRKFTSVDVNEINRVARATSLVHAFALSLSRKQVERKKIETGSRAERLVSTMHEAAMRIAAATIRLKGKRKSPRFLSAETQSRRAALVA